MLIVLPPSETKSSGGSLGPLDLERLSFSELNPVRAELVAATEALGHHPDAARILGLGKGAEDELERNRALTHSATRPALERYTGVLYDALNYPGMTKAQRAKARQRLAIGSALFGVVGAADPIPAYRLSAGTKLPGRATLAATWKPVLPAALGAVDRGLVVDLRSGGYAAFGAPADVVTATVVTEYADGSRKVVSHFNKHYKGLLAHALVTSRAEPDSARAIAKVAAKAGLRVEVTAANLVTIVT